MTFFHFFYVIFFYYFCVMSKKTNQEEFKKWERTYEFNDMTIVWKYDSKISKVNPYQVEIKQKSVSKKG